MLLVFSLAILVDLTFKEFPVSVHPVVLMGQVATAYTRRLTLTGTPRDWLPATGLILILLGLFVLPVAIIQSFWLLDALILSTTFSYGYFVGVLRKLQVAFTSAPLSEVRRQVGELVSRNTERLDRDDLLVAAVETAIENTTDSFVAPLFWYLIGGTPAAMTYRIFNTLDAMYGYKDRYLHYGRIAARIDDFLNFVPARLVAVGFWLLAPLRGDVRSYGWRIFRRDRHNTPSPNGGQTMAMIAGLLQIQLSKRDCYTLGDATQSIGTQHLEGSLWYVRASALLWFSVFGALSFALAGW